MRFITLENQNPRQTLPEIGGIGQFLGQESFVKKIWGNWVRAILGSCTMVSFAVVILLVSVLAGANPMKVRPFENITDITVATSEADMKVEYYLPYPGVLPDNPLYKLKAGRDKMILMVTFDKLKKAEKELLYADKRINAAVVLVEGGKISLGVSTATKAEKYLESSINRTVELQDGGRDVKSQLLTLEKAALKHLELLRGIGQKLSGQEKIVLDTTISGTEIQLEKVQQTLREAK